MTVVLPAYHVLFFLTKVVFLSLVVDFSVYLSLTLVYEIYHLYRLCLVEPQFSHEMVLHLLQKC